MLDHFKGGYVGALMQVFPDIGLDESQFDVASMMIYPSSPPLSPFLTRKKVNIGVI